jgi:hypothetical protein
LDPVTAHIIARENMGDIMGEYITGIRFYSEMSSLPQYHNECQ